MACGDNEEITVVDFRWAEWVCTAAILSRSCSLWVKKRTSEQVRVMSALGQKRTLKRHHPMSALCQKQTFMALFDHMSTHQMEISGQFRQTRCRGGALRCPKASPPPGQKHAPGSSARRNQADRNIRSPANRFCARSAFQCLDGAIQYADRHALQPRH